MKRIRVTTLSRRYDVLVGRGCLAQLGEQLARRGPRGQAVIVSDDNVAPHYLATVSASLAEAGYATSEIVVPAGETQKTLTRAEELYGVLYDRGVRRNDTVVALGGGVIGDLAGWVAATYLRGVNLVQAPTTLLAQVDASIGGKTAVDFRFGKNYVGTFYQPILVMADLDTLATLPARELRSGAAEVAKYGLFAGGRLLACVEQLARAPLAASRVSIELVAGCAASKAEVVSSDERDEGGGRAVLNFGHTIGHAIEAATGFTRYSHGEAVGLGLRAALRLSSGVCGLSPDQEAGGLALLDRLGLPQTFTGTTVADVCDLVKRDKKGHSGGVGYVLLEALGQPVLDVTVPPDLQREAVEWLYAR